MRLIDADELKKCAIPCEIHNGALTDLCVPLYQIDNAPTVERQKGEWLWLCDTPNAIYKWSCNKCGRGVKEQENFCPNCGAKMRGII